MSARFHQKVTEHGRHKRTFHWELSVGLSWAGHRQYQSTRLRWKITSLMSTWLTPWNPGSKEEKEEKERKKSKQWQKPAQYLGWSGASVPWMLVFYMCRLHLTLQVYRWQSRHSGGRSRSMDLEFGPSWSTEWVPGEQGYAIPVSLNQKQTNKNLRCCLSDSYGACCDVIMDW